MQLEKLGRPAVTIVSGRLEGDAAETARVFGMPQLQYVVVPWIYRNLDAERVLEPDGRSDRRLGARTYDLATGGKSAC